MKYDEYFIHQTEPSPLHPEGSFPGIPLMRIDDRYMKEAFYFECIWITGPIHESEASKPHRHDCDEYVGFFGSNIENPFNLNAEIQFWFEDEKYIINENCIVYIPSGKWHTPIIIDKIERPIFCLSTSPVAKYTQEISRDPKWRHLKDPLGSNQ
jgi:hypothetical protein